MKEETLYQDYLNYLDWRLKEGQINKDIKYWFC